MKKRKVGMRGKGEDKSGEDEGKDEGEKRKRRMGKRKVVMRVGDIRVRVRKSG